MPKESFYWKNFISASGEELHISHTPNNGLRLQILNEDLGEWAVFDVKSTDQAEEIIQALVSLKSPTAPNSPPEQSGSPTQIFPKGFWNLRRRL